MDRNKSEEMSIEFSESKLILMKQIKLEYHNENSLTEYVRISCYTGDNPDFISDDDGDHINKVNTLELTESVPVRTYFAPNTPHNDVVRVLQKIVEWFMTEPKLLSSREPDSLPPSKGDYDYIIWEPCDLVYCESSLLLFDYNGITLEDIKPKLH